MLRALLTCFALIIASPNYAHEFWIAPEKYQISEGQSILAHFRVGQDFKGSTQSWADFRTTQSYVAHGGTMKPYAGNLGDRPAMQVTADKDGLWILAHETANDFLTYSEWDKFTAFVQHKDFEGALQRHETRGLPQIGFGETYRRYAKTLVAVGSGAGQDGRVGFDIELVALDNPYTTTAQALPVQVWYKGVPRVDTQVEVFERSSDGAVAISKLRTDGNGIAMVPIKAGHVYMIDNVALEERDGTSSRGEVWHSMWANLTFMVP
ncbi:MAG: DUF4198 domain-containing protein [Planktomarina sp.]